MTTAATATPATATPATSSTSGTTTVLADERTEAEQRLERAKVKLQEHKSKGSSDKTIGQWMTRVTEAESLVSTEKDLALQGKSDPNTGINTSGDDDMAETKGSTKTRTKAIKTGGTTHCLCGCGSANNPGSKFNMGHDARLKSVIGKVSKGVEGVTIPKIAIESAEAGNFKVGEYDSKALLKIVAGSSNGTKPAKSTAKPKVKAKAGSKAKASK